jgi:hypothetical protein
MNTQSFASLPTIGQPLAGGTFCGLTTLPDGTHAAVVLLDEKPGKRLTWQDATDWAASLDAQLPNRPMAALLYANAKASFQQAWHWTNETDEDDASYAWYCYFYDGYQFDFHKSSEGCARAVRLIHLSA